MEHTCTPNTLSYGTPENRIPDSINLKFAIFILKNRFLNDFRIIIKPNKKQVSFCSHFPHSRLLGRQFHNLQTKI